MNRLFEWIASWFEDQELIQICRCHFVVNPGEKQQICGLTVINTSDRKMIFWYASSEKLRNGSYRETIEYNYT